jgi:hypothetical protein
MFKNFSPLIALFVVLILSGSITLLQNWRRRNRKSSDTFQIRATFFQKGFSFFSVLMTSLFTFVLSNSLSAFRCFAQDDGSLTLIGSPDFDCYDSRGMQIF